MEFFYGIPSIGQIDFMTANRLDFLQDARHYQMTYLSIFSLTGILFLEWYDNLLHYGVTYCCCIMCPEYWDARRQ